MNDFTISIYQKLLNNLIGFDYGFQTVEGYCSNPNDQTILLRHDVDARNRHSLQFAKIQHVLGITGTYYFRMVPQSYDEAIIKEIAGMGHEIGYHYETMDKANGDMQKAYNLFCRELEQLREIVPVKTICMHGSPLSRYDNRDLWKYYDYRDLGIIGEPYFDLDFSQVLYLTDTGRRWDGDKFIIRDKVYNSEDGNGGLPSEASAKEGDGKKVSIRDKVPEKPFGLESQRNSETRIQNSPSQNSRLMTQDFYYHSTLDIIEAIEAGTFPGKVMMTFHPQRWTDNRLLWSKELVAQNVKNVIKRGLKYISKI